MEYKNQKDILFPDALNGGLEAQRAAQRAAQMPALLWNLPHNK